ncbi:MAG: HD domain-containing protein, partial [Clostridia bacterium]|nr:HD domain-containing protein [Clostridia bacterium]
YAGGLAEHSIKVYKRLLMLVQNEYGENWQDTLSAESVAICGLLHDVCKINTYKVEMRNTKEDGVWVQKPYYTTEDPMPYGHGEKSVYMINGFMRLTREEAMAINWHMGPYDMRVKGGSFALSDVFYLYPTAMLMYMADLQAAYLDETTEKFAKKQQEQGK